MAEVLVGFGEDGRRVETVEWGLRHTKDSAFAKRGSVDARESEEHARSTAGVVAYGCGDTEVVSRTVVTYTTSWVAQEVAGAGAL